MICIGTKLVGKNGEPSVKKPKFGKKRSCLSMEHPIANIVVANMPEDIINKYYFKLFKTW